MALAVLILGGCSREQRHEVLTFFFTGVPPLEKEGAPAEDVAERGATAVRTARRTAPRPQAELPWTHGPYAARECEQCHSSTGTKPGGKTKSQSGLPVDMRGARVREPREELCIGCHTDQSADVAYARDLWLHGPAATGLCTVCHSPHQSRQRYMLLAATSVELCGQCHERTALAEMTPAHRKEPDTDCLSCHNPHLGRTAAMLKSEFDEEGRY